MRVIFIADAHLKSPSDLNYQVLLEFLQSQHGNLDMLVLLGDIFDFWIGKEAVRAEHKPIIEALERLCQYGTRLVYVEGNHDFHLGPIFTDRLKCMVFPDGGSIVLDGRTIYLAHGDLANPKDTGYLKLRNFLRSPIVRTLIRNLPNRLLMSIAAWISAECDRKNQAKQNMQHTQNIVRSYAQEILKEGFQAVVTGHFHLPFHETTQNGELIALGDWITQFSYAVYQDQSFALKSYQPSSSTHRSDS